MHAEEFVTVESDGQANYRTLQTSSTVRSNAEVDEIDSHSLMVFLDVVGLQISTS